MEGCKKATIHIKIERYTMSNKPKFIAYNVTDRKDDKSYWNRIGGAFEFSTADGRKGINIPALNLVLTEPKEEEPLEEAA